jgi:hypothetical protein
MLTVQIAMFINAFEEGSSNAVNDISRDCILCGNNADAVIGRGFYPK